VAEGIETALAVHMLIGLPVWATVSAGGMEAVAIPADVHEIYICGDNDSNGRGQEAARKLAGRLLVEGRKVRVAIPVEPDTDWADAWAKEVSR
jgi:putative DNA primase/helicase